MSTPASIQISKRSVDQNSIAFLEAELRELEDAYAECLGDNVDAKTLDMLWLRIKTIKNALNLSQ
jgi:hypothetical protein